MHDFYKEQVIRFAKRSRGMSEGRGMSGVQCGWALCGEAHRRDAQSSYRPVQVHEGVLHRSLFVGLACGLSHPSRFSPTTLCCFSLAKSRAIVSRRALRSRSRWCGEYGSGGGRFFSIQLAPTESVLDGDAGRREGREEDCEVYKGVRRAGAVSLGAPGTGREFSSSDDCCVAISLSRRR